VGLGGGLEEIGEGDRWTGAGAGDGARRGVEAGADTVGARETGGDKVEEGMGAGAAEG
jgi:hypothetical protein